MKCGVVVFPGSNCDRDIHHVFHEVLGIETEMLWHKDSDLKALGADDLVVLPGGFSYGDYLRTGAIARFSPIMNAIQKFASKGGKVLGICNGFQILCEAGLLPGALLKNSNQKYVCKNIHIKVENSTTTFTNNTSYGDVLKIPIAHGDGRFYANQETIDELKSKEQILFTYCSPEGLVNESVNPNGSIANIAGICNPSKNVFGMMPHPERAAESLLGNSDGLKLLSSFLTHVAHEKLS